MGDAELLRWLEERTLPILAQQGERAGVHGSGVIVAASGRFFLVTASHVARYFREHADDLGIPLSPRTRDCEIWTVGHGQLALACEENEDVAVLRLDDLELVAAIQKGGWKVVDAQEYVTDGESCVVFGWPQAQSRFDGNSLTGKPVALQLARIDGPPDRKATDLFLEWPSEVVPELFGISGSPLFSLRDSRLRLIGVQHSIKRDEYIRGTAWRVVLELIRAL